ncbi:MAG TPA: phosphatidate cytidylyltransferase, partial [Cytophagales bacterium]|nr:phosphatidate cytidylyltransferase [Cytophagales bacterium]
KKKPNKYLGTFIGLTTYVVVFLVEKEILPSILLILLFPLCALLFIYELYFSNKKPFNNVAYTLLGVLYV